VHCECRGGVDCLKKFGRISNRRQLTNVMRKTVPSSYTKAEKQTKAYCLKSQRKYFDCMIINSMDCKTSPNEISVCLILIDSIVLVELQVSFVGKFRHSLFSF
jgi:hypothetical protein